MCRVESCDNCGLQYIILYYVSYSTVQYIVLFHELHGTTWLLYARTSRKKISYVLQYLWPEEPPHPRIPTRTMYVMEITLTDEA